MGNFALKSYEFRRERESTWTELQSLVELAEKRGVRSLGQHELARLPELYRATVSSLSVARSISLDRNLVDYLEALSGRAYFCVYGTRRHVLDNVSDFFLRRFPQAVRKYKWEFLLAFVTMLAGALVGFLLTMGDSENFYQFVSADYAAGRDPTASTTSLRESLYAGGSADGLSSFASLLFTDNARVGMLAFALGFVLGVPTLLLIFTNGLVVGAFAALFHGRGLGMEFWGWVLPHGVTELLAVILCGAAGLILAKSMLRPGRFSRLHNLSIQGREAGIIVIGCVLMFFVAGLIEGFFRQLVTDTDIRYIVVVFSAVFWLLYLGFVGRRTA